MASIAAPPFDPFEALGLPRDAADATIKARYRELARRYHPNRHRGSEESKAALSERFHCIHTAWKHLQPDKRRRYVELLRLADEQADLLARMNDLLESPDGNKRTGHSSASHDGHVSSDADEDELPRMGLHRRRTTLEQATKGAKHLGDTPSLKQLPSSTNSLRKDSKNSEDHGPSTSTDCDAGEADYFSMRRKKLEKLRRKELAAFERYRNAMVEKFEAELEVERRREAYDNAQFKRDYFERAPKETAMRLRSFQRAISAFNAFGNQPVRRRNHSTVSYGGQILSTEDIFENGTLLTAENAASPSRTRPLRRRGWSSDISGDQTSSEEGSSGNTSPRPASSWTWHRHHSRNTSLDAFQLPSVWNTNGTSRASVPEHAPFRMLVKRPTGFNGPSVIDEQDYSPESNNTTPRSSTPQPSEQCGNTYTLVQNRRISELFEPNNRNEHQSAASNKQATGKVNGITLGSSQECHPLVVKRVNKPEFTYVPIEYVHELTYTEKSWLLGTQGHADADPADLMRRLARLDSNVADKFMVKPDILASFRFRLVYPQHVVGKAHSQSYIALSYRRQRHVVKKGGRFTLPLEAAMFQAVWDERQSNDEPVWIDQICIEDNRLETTISMSAMDMVYRGARLIVVALDDLVLDAHEADVLESHMGEYTSMLHVPATKRFRGKQPPYLDTHEELYQVLQKILRSSWFKRAWCRHEMRLARDHVFLVPCHSATSSGKSVVRFTSSCLTHLMALAAEVPFEPDIELVKPALHAFFRDRNKLAPDARQLHFHHGNFTTVVAEVFGMEAGGDPRIPAKQRAWDASKDKISIILNTMECGLALTDAMRDPSMPLTKSECHYMLLTLALAAQDPGALCSVGPPMRLTNANNTHAPLSPTATSTWLFEPTNVDSGLNNYRTLPRLPSTAPISTGISLGEHFVRLDLQFLQIAGPVHRGSDLEDDLQLAQYFLSIADTRKCGRNRQRYLIADSAANRHFGDMRACYESTLACVFSLGPEWVEQVCRRYGVARWKQDGEAAWDLLVALKSTLGKWPESAWSAAAVGFVMDFVNFLVIRGMPQRQILHREQWRPVWVVLDGGGGKVLTFVPPGEGVRPAIPEALLDEDYVHLARLWVLEPRLGFHGQGGSWTLLGKSVLFSDDLAVRQIRAEGGEGVRGRQHSVFGREDPEIQRLLRERSLHF